MARLRNKISVEKSFLLDIDRVRIYGQSGEEKGGALAADLPAIPFNPYHKIDRRLLDAAV